MGWLVDAWSCTLLVARCRRAFAHAVVIIAEIQDLVFNDLSQIISLFFPLKILSDSKAVNELMPKMVAAIRFIRRDPENPLAMLELLCASQQAIGVRETDFLQFSGH